MKNGNIINNSIWPIIQNIISMILSFTLGVITARVLGSVNYGILGVTASITTIIFSVAKLGIDSILVKEIICAEKKEYDVVWTVFVTRIITSFLAIIFSLIVGVILKNDEKYYLVVLLISGIALLFQSYEVFVFWFQSKLLLKYVSLSIFISQIIVSIYQFYIIFSRKNIVWFATASLFQNILVFISLLYIFRKLSKSKVRFDFRLLKNILNKSKHYAVSALAISLYMHIDKVMIGNMLSDSEAGIYSVAVNLALCWQFIPLAIINSFRPIVLKYKEQKDDKYIKSYKSMVFIVTYISIFLGIVFSVFSKTFVSCLYGMEYIDAIIPLRVTVWSTFISMIGVSRGVWLVAEDYNKYDKYFTLLAAIINIVLNFFMINKLGVFGAALATIISYFMEVFVFNYLFKNTRNYNRLFFESIFEWKNNILILTEYLKNKKF